MVTMFDNIDAASIPANAQACAGYAGGKWPDFGAMLQRFPNLAKIGRVKSIAINDTETAHILDVETGDATPEQAPGWVNRMLAKPASVGVYKPAVYANASTMPAVKKALDATGLKRDQYMLWIADWTYTAHLPAGYEACQWTDKAGPDDESLCLDSFFPPLPAPAPTPEPQPHGVAHALLSHDLAAGSWSLHSLPGMVRWQQQPKWASVEVQLGAGGNISGQWRTQPLEWNAPPLGD